MRRPRVFVTRRLPDRGLSVVLEHCDIEVWPHDTPPSRADLLAAVAQKDGVITLLTDIIDSEVMAAGVDLKVISNCAVGVDNIDIRAASARGIPVGNTPDVLTDATADLAFGLLLATARRIVEGAEYVKAGNWRTWDPQLLLGADLAGRTLGIIGFGRIGQAMARRARGFGLRICYVDHVVCDEPDVTRVDMDDLLSASDFVSLHVPLNEGTHHLINDDTLARMKPTAILINTSRGPVVDHAALYRALYDGRLFAAGLDVTEPEPLPADSPLLTLPNCVVVPHLGSASLWTREQMALLAAENLIAGVQGRKLPHCVNPEVYNAMAPHSIGA
ncbi:MAG TPA: D-glycerate dehydrogenase [Anaerolineales bacterium]|nr:D-glycerate dehydrogenase [Anaerolineales bacterium]